MVFIYDKDQDQNCSSRARNIVRHVVGGIICAAIVALVMGFLTKWIWNAIMPDLFGLSTVTYWQAVGLVVLGKLIFGIGKHGHSGSGSSRPGLCRPSPREKIFADRPDWAELKEFWAVEGKDAYEKYLDRRKQRSASGSESSE